MTKKIFYLTLIVLLFSCSSDEPDFTETQEVSLPKLQTNEVTDITLYSVKAGGKLIDTGDSDILEVGLVVGTTTLPTTDNNINKFILNPDASGNFDIAITNIPANTTYYIRAYGINSDGIGYGNEVQFTSPEENVYPENIALSSQEEVVEFGANNYNRIAGRMDITGTVSDLSPLESIVILDGSLRIRNTINLQNFEGLNNLKIIGNFFSTGLWIENNTSLESLSGLNNLETTRGEMYIKNNDNLINLEGLDSFFAIIDGDFSIRDCDGLQSLTGIENLQYISGSFVLINNSTVQNINGLEGITSLDRVSIYNNSSLANLDGLSNVTTISQAITILNNDNLNDLSAFQNLNTVRHIGIEDNDALIDLRGFNNLNTIEGLGIRNNSNLTSLNGIENLNSLKSLTIESNTSLINIEGLNGLTSIIGSSYPININNNTNLNSLTGLENLTQVEGFIQIFSNSTLSDFCALKNLFVNGNHSGDIYFAENLNNPTEEEIVNNCN